MNVRIENVTRRVRESLLAALLLITLVVLTNRGAGAANLSSSYRAASTVSPSLGGVVLDGYGGISTFGGFSLNSVHQPYWAGWDIARSVAIMQDGSGGWMLDGFGGITAFGNAPQIATPSYTPNVDIARAIFVLPNMKSGYMLDGYGGMHAFGGATTFARTPYWAGWDVVRGLDIHVDQGGNADGGAMLDAFGGVHPFGTYPYSLTATNYYGGRDVFQHLHQVTGHVYLVGKYGKVIEKTAGAAMDPAWGGYVDHGNTDIIRDIVLVGATSGISNSQPMSKMANYGWEGAIGQRGGAVLDGFGGVRPFGGLALNTSGVPTWPGWNIARSLVVLPDGSGGWTLDGFGGIHGWGGAPLLDTTGSPYWAGWDIARALVVNPDRRSGYMLDGFGGVHALGHAPAFSDFAYWPYWDIARGLTMHYTNDGVADGGWTLDGFGGIHRFGAAPAEPGPQYWPFRDLYQQLHETYDGHMHVIGKWGTFFALSAATSPHWSGYSDWGAADVLRDVALLGDDDMNVPSQPMSSAAVHAWWTHVWVYNFNVAPVQQEMPLDCEAAALEEAIRAKRGNISQFTIFNELPQQPGSAVWAGGNISRWGNPYSGFVGNVYGSERNGTGYGVYDGPIAQVAINHGFNAIGLESGIPEQIYTYLALGDPVVIFTSDTFRPVPTHYWTAWDGRPIPYSLTDHAVTLVAIDGVGGTITLNDVLDGRMKTFTLSQFASFWIAYLDMAVVLT